MRKPIEMLNRSVGALTQFLLFGMVTIVFSQIVFRSVFQQPLSWSGKLSRYVLVWVILDGGGNARARGGIQAWMWSCVAPLSECSLW